MRRIALSVIVGLLTFSASGVYSLVINEPCTGYESPEVATPRVLLRA